MANCVSCMHLCILRLGQKDRMMLLRHGQQQTGSLDRSLHSLHFTSFNTLTALTVTSQVQEVSLWNKRPFNLHNVQLVRSMQRKRFSQKEHARKAKTCTTAVGQAEFSETCRTLCNSSLFIRETKGSSVLPQKYFWLYSVKMAKIILCQLDSR